MLQFIRDRAQGWFAWVIVGFITVPFALWGVNEYLGGGTEVPAATVNDVSISKAEVETAYYRQRERLQQILGENFNPAMFPEERIREQVLDELIRRELLVQAALEAGMQISDMHLAQAVRGFSEFQSNGEFDPALYKELLARQGMSPAYFESRLYRDLLIQQYLGAVTKTAFVTPYVRDRYLSLSNQTRDVGYMPIPAERFADEVSVSDEEIETYYQANGSSFMVPERVRIAAIELDVDAMASTIEVSEEDARIQYDSQSANYRTPEERRASHILIGLDNGETEALEKAEQVLQELQQGASFAELAEKYSDDPGSANNGGDLGYFGRGMMDENFEDAVFSLEMDAISEPVRSAFGYHIIRLDGIRGGEAKPFDEIKDSIISDIRRDKAEQIFYDKADQLANLAYEHPDSLEPAAEALGLSVTISEPFSRTGGTDALTANPKVTDAAFSEEVLLQGVNSDVIDLGTSHIAVIRVHEHLPSEKRPLSEVKPQIVEQLKRRKQIEYAKVLAAEVIEELESGSDPEAIAKQKALNWQRQESMSRVASDVPRAIADAVFAMPRPQAGKVFSHSTVAAGNGEQWVLLLYGVDESADGFADGEKREAEKALLDIGRESMFVAVEENLRGDADISGNNR